MCDRLRRIVRFNMAYCERFIRVSHVSGHVFPISTSLNGIVISCFASGKEVSSARSRCRGVSHHHAVEIFLQDPLIALAYTSLSLSFESSSQD